MALGLDDAVLGWLVAAAGDALFRGVRGDRTKKAMRQLLRDATIATVAQVGAHLDSRRAKHLGDVLLGHGAQDNRTTVSSPAELQTALQTWIMSLDHPPYDYEPSYLESLGTDAGQLCQTLTGQVTSRIRDGDRIGDPLEPVAQWLFRSEVRHDHGEIKRDLDQIKLELSRIHHLVEPPSPGYGGLPGGTPDFTGRQEALEPSRV